MRECNQRQTSIQYRERRRVWKGNVAITSLPRLFSLLVREICQFAGVDGAAVEKEGSAGGDTGESKKGGEALAVQLSTYLEQPLMSSR